MVSYFIPKNENAIISIPGLARAVLSPHLECFACENSYLA